MNHREPRVTDLYWRFCGKLMEVELHFHDDERKLAAYHCVLYMYYFVVWNADGVERFDDPSVNTALGNDIAEVDDDYLPQCLERAVAASATPDATEAWLREQIASLQQAERQVNGDDVGMPLHREDFEVPPC